MRNILKLIILLSLFACGFNANQKSKELVKSKRSLASPEDIDGDFISNEDEVKLGTNPYIADLPNLKVRFLQNYKIEVDYKVIDQDKSNSDLLKFIIDTKTSRDDPSFKYRVGRVFIRDKSFKDSAKVGQFNDHSWGEIFDHDLSWITYPKVDTSFFASNVLNYKSIFNNSDITISNIKVSLENSVRLQSIGQYQEIKNLELSFYYFDYEKDSYELLAIKRINRTFKSDVNEIFTVNLENLPVNLIEHNYMKKGEFIISEVSDYEIPKLKTTYKKLIRSIRSKSIPVVYNTPFEQNIYYVALTNKADSFINILSHLFDNKFSIKNNKLVKINQFQNNLPSYKYLFELKNEDKLGRWFVFTNKLNKHYLSHSFIPSDIISVSYVLGKQLAKQKKEEIFNYKDSISSTATSAIYPLGNITPNSKVDIQISPNMIFGEKKTYDSFQLRPIERPCSGNCVGVNYACDVEVNTFEDINNTFIFKNNLSGKFSNIFLVIDDTEYLLNDLIDQKKVKLSWVNKNNKANKEHIHLVINNINNILKLSSSEEHVLFIKLVGIRETTFNGLKLNRMYGDAPTICPHAIAATSSKQNIPISPKSKDFNLWRHLFNWNILKIGQDKTWEQEFSIGLFSLITNNYN